MIKTVFFDLDGTLLPMDQDVFLKEYFRLLTDKMKLHGYDPDPFAKSIWACTGAMVRNNGKTTNEEIFWNCFSEIYGRDMRAEEPHFLEFYQNAFQEVQQFCGFNPCSADTVRNLKKLGFRLILATNPLFPAIATHSRIRWAGLNPEDFEWITTYENSSYCKPNPDYYREILDKLNLQPDECLMVGNDAQEDMVAVSAGMHVFLLTDCLINKYQINIDAYPHGSFQELSEFLQR